MTDGEPVSGGGSASGAGAGSERAAQTERGARFAESHVVPLASRFPAALANILRNAPLLGSATYMLAVVERVAPTLFLMILMVRNFSSPGSFMALLTGQQCLIMLRSIAWSVNSLRNAKAAAYRLGDPRFRVSEVDDWPRLAGPGAVSELHRYRAQPPRVRVFTVLARDGVQIDDRTFTSYRGTSYVCMSRDPRTARRAGAKFRLLHELGHASGVSMGSVEYEIVPVIQLIGLGVVLYAFAPTTPVSLVCLSLLIALTYTIAKPFGPNRESLGRECKADAFAIRHLGSHEVREGVDDALLNPYRYQLRKLAGTRKGPDQTDLDQFSLEFYDHPRIDTLDWLRPSFHTSRSPAWLRGHELERIAIRAGYAQRALTGRLAGARKLDLGSPYAHIPGWWQVRPLLTVPLAVVAAFQVDLPRFAWIWFTAAGVILFFTYVFMLAREFRWQSYIDKIVARRSDAGEESEEGYRRAVEAAIAETQANRRQQTPQGEPPATPAAYARVLLLVLLCSLSATLLVAYSPGGAFHSLSIWLALIYLTIAPGVFAYQLTQSRRMSVLARRLAYLPSCALVVLTLLHRI